MCVCVCVLVLVLVCAVLVCVCVCVLVWVGGWVGVWGGGGEGRLSLVCEWVRACALRVRTCVRPCVYVVHAV